MFRSDSSNAVLRAVAIPTAIALLLLTAIVGAVLHISTSTSDALALERQHRLVRIAVEQNMSAIATDQEASTYWDDAVLRTRERPLDLEWIDNNLGVWFHTYYKHDETYLLDPRNRPLYAMQGGRRAQPSSFERVGEPAEALADDLRRRMAGSYLAPEGSPGQTVGASRIAVVAGRPAIISIKPIVSETGDIVQHAGSEYLHVSVRYLDGSFLERLSGHYGIDRAAFSWKPVGAASLPIMGASGNTIGFITWTPFEPGEQVETRMAPVLCLALLAVGLLISLLLLRIWRSRTELEASRAQAQHLAFHDNLTGLPNRALFHDRLDHALGRRGHRLAVLLLDLDRFKHVNDTLGHQAGDALIREFGLRLASLIREGDTIARLGGDEFAMLIENSELSAIERLAERILKEVARPFEVLGAQAFVGVSIGIAISSDQCADRVELVRRADIALYRAKDEGRNGYRLFSSEMDASVQLRGTIEEELRQALATDRGLSIHYQPQVSVGGQIVGFEALIRWDHPTRGQIVPEQFIPIAEETGLVVALGEWVLRQACNVSLRWPQLFIAVNLSPVQFRSSGFLANLLGIVQSVGANPARIQLEVTERVLLDDDEAIRTVLHQLREAGFTIVLDDFGTGYSSLSYLRKFEVDKIKIDRSFVQHLGEASDSGAIVTAVLALGQAMGMSVSAEGVETAAQQMFLELAGCKLMQGFHFSRALPADELHRLMDGGKTPAVA